mmetsp:Transcript_22862/g.53346  ORF Transcript_22862/g.53346 Transcript_22862/m.53346 type:complete len:305 (-) Transcript_22862:1392-2306(-)
MRCTSAGSWRRGSTLRRGALGEGDLSGEGPLWKRLGGVGKEARCRYSFTGVSLPGVATDAGDDCREDSGERRGEHIGDFADGGRFGERSRRGSTALEECALSRALISGDTPGVGSSLGGSMSPKRDWDCDGMGDTEGGGAAVRRLMGAGRAEERGDGEGEGEDLLLKARGEAEGEGEALLLEARGDGDGEALVGVLVPGSAQARGDGDGDGFGGFSEDRAGGRVTTGPVRSGRAVREPKSCELTCIGPAGARSPTLRDDDGWSASLTVSGDRRSREVRRPRLAAGGWGAGCSSEERRALLGPAV